MDLAALRQQIAIGQANEVELMLRRAGSLKDAPEARLVLAVAIAHQHRYDEASQILLPLQEEFPTNIECLNWAGICARETGDFVAAEEAFSDALELRPNDPGTMFNLGVARLRAGKAKLAIASLEAAACLVPGNPHVHQQLGLAYQGIGDLQKAEESLRKSAKLAPFASEPLVSLASLYLSRGLVKEAERAVLEALKLSPTNFEAKLVAVRAAIACGNHEEAQADLERLNSSNPNDWTVLNLLASERVVSGRIEEGIELYRKSAAIQPQQGVAYWGIVGNQRSLEDSSDLVLQLEQILANPIRLSFEDSAYLNYSLGRIQELSGDYELATKHFDRANREARLQAFGPEYSFPFDRYERHLGAIQRMFGPEAISKYKQESEPFAPIFIVGTIRSGTTLIEQILSRHPGIVSAGELPFWLSRSSECISLESESLDLPKAKRLVEEYRAQVCGGLDKRATDKMPENLQAVGLLHILMPKAKFLWVRRRGPDTCLSIYTTPFAVPPEFAHDRESIAFAWRQNEALGEHWLKILPNDVIHSISYEDLVGHPDTEIRHLVEFCGLEWNNACLQPEESQRPVATPSAWQVRQAIYSSSTARWTKFARFIPEFEFV